MDATVSSKGHSSSGAGMGGIGPWVAVILVVCLLLCCLGILGVALLDELVASHPLRTLVMGTPTPTSTWTPSPSATPTETPFVTATYTPTPPAGVDRFEPDDSVRQATEIDTAGEPQTHTLSPAGDRDYVSFWAREGLQYTMETGNLGEQCDTVLTLYDAEGTELARDDDGADESLASRLTWVADQEGTLFVEIFNFSEAPEGANTSYDIWVTQSEPVVYGEDEYEPDDMMSQANEILPDVPQTHTIHVMGDHDWLFFDAEEGITYVIETSDLGSDMDTMIHLYDDGGEELAQNDDGGEQSLASRITWRADSAGVFYVRIHHYWDDTIGPGMHYTVSVTEGAPFEADAYEPDDSADAASMIEVGSSQNHNLHLTGDDDWISFQAAKGADYVIETFNLADRIDTVITLYDADGQELASDDDGGGEPLASRITWTAVEDGLLYVRVQDLGDDEAGPQTEYTISVREQRTIPLTADEYEPDDTTAEASEIQVGEVQGHNVHVEGDHDWLWFEAVQGTTYLIETSNLGHGLDTIIFLYDDNGQELAQDDDGGEEARASRITWSAERTDTFYVLVRDYEDDRAERGMEYEISICETGAAPDEARVYIADGAYHIMAYEVNNFVVGISERLYLGNFTLEVDAAQVSGDNDNEYGVVCGYRDDDNYYEVAISGDGYAGFFAREGGNWDTVVTFMPNEGISQGNAANHLRLDVREGRFSFHINGQLAFVDFDDRFGDGLIGFGCGPFTEPGLQCSFDDLTVWDGQGSLVWQDDFDDNTGNWFETPSW